MERGLSLLENEQFPLKTKWYEADFFADKLTEDQQPLQRLTGQSGWVCFAPLEMLWLHDTLELITAGITDTNEALDEDTAWLLMQGAKKREDPLPANSALNDFWRSLITDCLAEEYKKQETQNLYYWNEALQILNDRYAGLTTTSENRLADLASECRTQRRQLYSHSEELRREGMEVVEALHKTLVQEREDLMTSQLSLAEERAVLVCKAESFAARKYTLDFLVIARWSVYP